MYSSPHAQRTLPSEDSSGALLQAASTIPVVQSLSIKWPSDVRTPGSTVFEAAMHRFQSQPNLTDLSSIVMPQYIRR